MGDQAFSSVAPKLWNSLPTEIRQAEHFSVFKSSLKMFYSVSIFVIFYFIVLVLSYVLTDTDFVKAPVRICFCALESVKSLYLPCVFVV